MDANLVVIKAVQKAINNGWREDEFRGDKRLKWPPQDITLVEDRDYYSNSGWWIESNTYRNLSDQVCQSDYYEDLIYNHDFAKALWGEYQVCQSCGYKENIGDTNDHDAYCSERNYYYPIWQYYLQQMVIADDPIAYLGDNLPA